MIDRIPQVFISYSWTSEDYQNKIVDLASRMRHDGIDVKLDVWDLKDGQDKYVYMEQCVTNPEIDNVLIFSDRLYAEKADQRKGGVGDETTIISPEIYGNAEQNKFIPIVMERDEDGHPYLPSYLKSRLYRDFSGDNIDAEYEGLLRSIFDVPSHRKPEIGERPSWLTDEEDSSLYPVKKVVRTLGAVDLKAEGAVTIRDFTDLYIEAIKPFFQRSPTEESYLESFVSLKEYRNAFLDSLREFSKVNHFGEKMADEFEYLYNTLFNIKTFIPHAMQCGELEFDIYRVHIWELFICTVAFMLHFEMFDALNELLVHTYFLRQSGLAEAPQPSNYEGFRFHSKMIEEYIKPNQDKKLQNKYTLTGHYICTEREYLPIYTGKAIANADLFLYQVYNGLNIDNISQFSWIWFPTCYAYADEYDSLWKKLISKRFCEKIMPLFGVSTIEDLKERVSHCTPNRSICYSGGWTPASAILTWIKVDNIASLP